MIEVVFALLLIVDNEIKEHRIQESIAQCLRRIRESERTYSESISYKCYRGMAGTEIYMGEKKITSLILD